MKCLLIPLFLVMLTTTIMAATLEATISPTTVAPGNDLKLILTTKDVPNGKWFVAYDVTLNGGCTRKENNQATISDFMLDEVNVDQTKEYNIKTPSTEGTCSISVDYQYTGSNPRTTKIIAEITQPEPQTVTEPVAPPQQQQPPAEPAPQQPAQQPVTSQPEETSSSGATVAIIIAVIIIIGLIIYFVKGKKK
jgi:hypothetical protein